MQFVDRMARYPGRWTAVKENGTSEVITLVRNDEPIVEGTPINANTLNALGIESSLNIGLTVADGKICMICDDGK